MKINFNKPILNKSIQNYAIKNGLYWKHFEYGKKWYIMTFNGIYKFTMDNK